MQFTIAHTSLAEIEDLRVLFLQENNFQFVYNKCHQFGWADTYVFLLAGTKIGYGAVWGKDKREDRDSIFEFYLLPAYRHTAGPVFSALQTMSKAAFVECQTNDALLSEMLYEHCIDLNAEAILFKEHFTTCLQVTGVVFRKANETDGDGGYVLELAGETVATGGFVWNYNLPFIDMFYEVHELYRKKGLGSMITQELKREAYRLGRVPAARCNINNHASRATLLKAGMQVCGYIVTGMCK